MQDDCPEALLREAPPPHPSLQHRGPAADAMGRVAEEWKPGDRMGGVRKKE